MVAVGIEGFEVFAGAAVLNKEALCVKFVLQKFIELLGGFPIIQRTFLRAPRNPKRLLHVKVFNQLNDFLPHYDTRSQQLLRNASIGFSASETRLEV